MAKRFGADFYLHSRRNGRQKIYTSYKDLSWPVGLEDMVVSQQLPSPFPRLANLIKANCYPLPVIMTPASFEADKAERKEKRKREDNLLEG